MNGQEASLSNLRGILEPEPPPFWPPAPGVWVALIIAVAVLLAFVLWWQRARARSAYRRAGLSLLAGARTARDIDVILKRVALAVFPRPTVAPLYGDDWVAFLEATCSQARFAALGAVDPSAEASTELRQMAGTWIRQHRVTKGGP
jgi:hypothetical protein